MMVTYMLGGRQVRSPRYLDAVYRMPNENRSLDDYYRARHLDVPHLDDLDLVLEERCVLARLSYEGNRECRSWLIARRDAILRERRRRQTTNRPAGLPAPPAARADAGRAMVPVRGRGRRGR